jgi:pyruvate kinase
MASLNAVIRVMDRLRGVDSELTHAGGFAGPAARSASLEKFTLDTLGPAVTEGSIRIMVTMPSEAASEPSLIESLVEQGMTIMRINCAHDGPELWAAMVNHLNAARAKSGKPCRVAFDLAGPKLRTGPIEASQEPTISVSAGDVLVVTRDLAPGRPATLDSEQNCLEPARIGCTLAEVFDSIAVGDRVLLDDGKFEGVVSEVLEGQFRVKIARAGRGKAKLKAEKGINLPDTRVAVPALTPKDIEDLRFVVKHGDLVSFSFVRSPADIDQLYEVLRFLGAPEIGVVLKIENRAAFETLPQLLLTAAKRKRIAVMVARGDLGVEIGFERLAEVQEQILWLCEAAEVPVIWATQVLESLAKSGLPSRGEVTDAAMSVRAECVMLNKGPYIAHAIRFLTDVSKRMRQHASKTFATHRALSVAAADWLAADRSNDAGFERFQT